MPAGVDTFVQTVVRSGLLRQEEVEDALRLLPDRETIQPDRLAQQLIQLGKLSRFQAHKLLQGATLGLRLGPYVIQTPIGRGGMGCVYLALDSRTGRHVAVKVLPPKRAREEERTLARFQREMAMSQRVNHPHIARTFECGVWQGVYYIAMEYIPGQSLYRAVTSRGPLAVDRAARLFTEVAGALEHAHQMGLIHRDLKPSNIMVTPRDHAKVLDLGLALMEGEEGELEVVGGKGYVLGSADYMAPEQTRDATQVDPRSDVYALGCTLYFAFTGAPPFPAGTMKEKIQAHRHQEPGPLQWRNKGVPDDFAKLVHQMLAKNPEDRPQNMSRVRDALKPWSNAEEVQPLDEEGDPNFLRALAEIEQAPQAESLVDVPIVDSEGANADAPLPGGTALPPPHPELLRRDDLERRLEELRRIAYVVAGFCGFLLLLLALLLFLVLR